MAARRRSSRLILGQLCGAPRPFPSNSEYGSLPPQSKDLAVALARAVAVVKRGEPAVVDVVTDPR
jgi:hypothetical protein